MTAPTTKRGRDRPRKQPENPGCELASKGYVKCVVRKSLGHTHTQKVDGTFWFIGALFGGFFTLAAISYLSVFDFVSQYVVPLALFTLVCIIGFLEMIGMYHESTSEADDESPDYLKKYEPPCEPKRGCEEQEV